MSMRSLGWLLWLGCFAELHEAIPQRDMLNVLFMADIGHVREHSHALTSPSIVMGKSVEEGAFSLYDGLADFVLNQGERPDAVLVAGDVGYGGGVDFALGHTKDAFQKYLGGHVPVDSVFPLIGNHDVNYFGCMVPEVVSGRCYYGGRQTLGFSSPDLNFSSWRHNWLTAFPGLTSKALKPASSDHDWLAPLRYNLDVKKDSSVYFIMGLISGANEKTWGDDTPKEAREGGVDAAQAAMECAFLADSLTWSGFYGNLQCRH
eukprot:TRINITY_DN28557_c0_g1_i2.p1 TRINITY_DN28557_c0_g1~~TRINITY_DN28557_c0_g1_i2.p1  ORF type:complete len:261 (+),score=34.06 TRINITY_DN28557_c0_g1_i2:90-872(+)